MSRSFIIRDTMKNKLRGDWNGETCCSCACPLTWDLASSTYICGCAVNRILSTVATWVLLLQCLYTKRKCVATDGMCSHAQYRVTGNLYDYFLFSVIIQLCSYTWSSVMVACNLGSTLSSSDLTHPSESHTLSDSGVVCSHSITMSYHGS
jgi:hypothetical protein